MVNLENAFPKATASKEEFLVCTQLLPAIRDRFGAGFATLEIPELLGFDETVGANGTVYFQRYKGETFNDRWNEENGGSPLGTELASEMVHILKDLLTIDVDWLLSAHSVGSQVRGSAFDLDSWLQSFRAQRSEAIQMGIPACEFEQAESLVAGGFQLEHRIISNGDFYPRNLVRLP